MSHDTISRRQNLCQTSSETAPIHARSLDIADPLAGVAPAESHRACSSQQWCNAWDFARAGDCPAYREHVKNCYRETGFLPNCTSFADGIGLVGVADHRRSQVRIRSTSKTYSAILVVSNHGWPTWISRCRMGHSTKKLSYVVAPRPLT